MAAVADKASIDPFADDIVNDPRRVEYSVPGLNEKVAEKIVAGVRALSRSERPRVAARSPKAVLIVSPRAGFGKSHLVGTLFRQLSGEATLVNVRPFEDPDTRWKSILMRIVQELKFPDRFSESHGDGDGESATQLELFAHGVLSQVVADLLTARKGNEKTIATLRRPAGELTMLKRNRQWRAYLDKNIVNGRWIGEVEQRLTRAGFNMHCAPATWIKILYGYAYRDDDWNLRQSCLDWIQCDPVDDEAARAVGMRPADLVRVDQTAGELNDLAKSRVLDLCRLAGFFRPFLICFDQTETYGKSPELARALGTVIMDLTDEASNQLTLITANLDPWEKRLRAHWERASLDRLSKPMTLESIDLPQAIALVENRLRLLDVDVQAGGRFLGDRQWLQRLLSENPQMSVRMFLNECSRRWAGGGEEPTKPEPIRKRTPLATLFKRYIDDISAKPRRLVYDRDVFYWLVSDLAAGVQGITADRITSKSREHLPRWRHGNKQFVFGFESGSHWKRWHNIARSALAGGPDGNSILVYPRTPELSKIPRSTWNVAKADIEDARRSRLLIVEVGMHQLVRLYAARELYADAVQGDIDWRPEEVAQFLRRELTDFWRSILEWPDNAPEEPEPPVEPAPENLQNKVVDVVRRRKFLSLDELIDKLPGSPDREAVLGICGETSHIKVHTHPNMTVVQWQSTA
ncbi:MAG: hypothetical protein WB783_17150 [Arenicellales bacterium]